MGTQSQLRWPLPFSVQSCGGACRLETRPNCESWRIVSYTISNPSVPHRYLMGKPLKSQLQVPSSRTYLEAQGRWQAANDKLCSLTCWADWEIQPNQPSHGAEVRFPNVSFEPVELQVGFGPERAIPKFQSHEAPQSHRNWSFTLQGWAKCSGVSHPAFFEKRRWDVSAASKMFGAESCAGWRRILDVLLSTNHLAAESHRLQIFWKDDMVTKESRYSFGQLPGWLSCFCLVPSSLLILIDGSAFQQAFQPQALVYYFKPQASVHCHLAVLELAEPTILWRSGHALCSATREDLPSPTP